MTTKRVPRRCFILLASAGSAGNRCSFKLQVYFWPSVPLVRGQVDCGLNSHDPDKMLPLFTDDVFYEDVAFGEVSHGSAELRKFFLSEIEGVTDLELKLERASIHGDHGTIEWTFSGTDKGVYKTGKEVFCPGASA